MLRYLVALTILVAAGAACGSDGGFGPGLGFAHASVTLGCGPADGPAVAFYLASHPIDPRSPAPPYIRIVVWDAPATVAGRTWRLGGNADTASAVLVRGADDYENARSGKIAVGVIDTASTTDGSAFVLFPSLGLVSGDFHAVWSPATHLCG